MSDTQNFVELLKENRYSSEYLLYSTIFKADLDQIPADWKIGCKEYWEFHHDRYNPNYNKT